MRFYVKFVVAIAIAAVALAGRGETENVPEGYMPHNVIPLGYPAENPPAKDKWNPAAGLSFQASGMAPKSIPSD